MDGLNNLFWLVVFVAVGFPIALGIELFLRRGKPRSEHADAASHGSEFMPVPRDSAIARRMREPAQASIDGE